MDFAPSTPYSELTGFYTLFLKEWLRFWKVSVQTVLAPVLTAGGTLNYTENQAATAIDTTITLTDDATTLVGATVTISTNCAAGEDVLDQTFEAGMVQPITIAQGRDERRNDSHDRGIG